MNPSKKGPFLIIIATVIWGAGAAAQYGGMAHVGPLTFNAARFLIGGLLVLPPSLYFWRREKRTENSERTIGKSTLRAGILCGVVLCLAINLQQYGYFLGLPAGRVGFLTALYVIFVPILGLIFMKKKPSVFVWLGVAISLAGMFFLNFSDGFSMNPGDFFIVLCAVVFAVQILLVGFFSPKQNVIVLACVQYFTVAIVSAAFAFLFETPNVYALVGGGIPILYTGVLSSGVAYLLQMKAQKTTAPTVAAVIFSFEGVVSALAGWLILSQILTPMQILGCALIFAATLVAQINPSRIATSRRTHHRDCS